MQHKGIFFKRARVCQNLTDKNKQRHEFKVTGLEFMQGLAKVF